MNTIIVIPARGGSKRVFRKNMAKVQGVSLLEWAVAAARGLSHWLVVSSDDQAILDEGARLGTLRFVRQPGHAEHWSGDLPIAQQVVTALSGDDDDLLVWLRPTAPFRTSENVQEVIEFMNVNRDVDSVRSVMKSTEHPLKSYRVVGELHDQPWLAPWLPSEHRANHPDQYLPASYRPVGWIDAVRLRCIRAGSMEGFTIVAWPVPGPDDRSLDINTEEDLERAHDVAGRRRWRPGVCE